MKLNGMRGIAGYNLSETMIATGIASLMLAATLTSSIALKKSFGAVDNFFSTQLQQIRIIDYLSRDVKRSTIVTTSADLQTVTCTVPNYVIQTGDPDAGGAGVNPGLSRRTPSVTFTGSGAVVNYGATTSTVVYAVNNQSIQRTENGVLTTIASSTDQLVPQTTDTELANTEFTTSTVTFLPIFTSGNAAMERTGTTVFATAYLRNKRKG